MAFDFKVEEFEGLPAMPALAMALFEQTGLTDLIDDYVQPDCRKVLTPGNAVKAMIGKLLSHNERIAASSMQDFYADAPIDRLFGEKVKLESLEGTAFSRDLDDLFKVDLQELTFDCYSNLCQIYNLSSDIFNVDCTNFGMTALSVDADAEGVAIPQRCGHAKDGHNELLVYSLLSVTDENGIVCYEKPYDGATNDSVMDRHAIEYLSTKVSPSATTLVADCKMASGPLVKLMTKKGFGFVSKCPDNFGKHIRKTIVDSVEAHLMDPSSVRDGWELYDTDAEVDGTKLRFVAFRTGEDIAKGIGFLKVQGGKEAKSRFSRFASKLFNCAEDARRAFSEALDRHKDSAYDVEHEIVEVQVRKPRDRPGRPPKDYIPEYITQYKVDVKLEFNLERARELTEKRNVRVLVTNLPRAMADADNVRDGATADAILKIYLGQFRVEHAFRLMKSGMGMSTVYIHKPSRENAMMFVIALATMLSDVIYAVLKKNGIQKTAEKLAAQLENSMLRFDRDRDSIRFCGVDSRAELFVSAAKALKVDLDRLF